MRLCGAILIPARWKKNLQCWHWTCISLELGNRKSRSLGLNRLGSLASSSSAQKWEKSILSPFCFMTKHVLQHTVPESGPWWCHKVLWNLRLLLVHQSFILFETCGSSSETKTSRVLFCFKSAEQSRCGFLWNVGWQPLCLRSEVSSSSSPSSSWTKSCFLCWSHQETDVTDTSHTVSAVPALHRSASLPLCPRLPRPSAFLHSQQIFQHLERVFSHFRNCWKNIW